MVKYIQTIRRLLPTTFFSEKKKQITLSKFIKLKDAVLKSEAYFEYKR